MRALVRSRGRRGDVNVEEGSERRSSNDDHRDRWVDTPQVSRNPVAEAGARSGV